MEDSALMATAVKAMGLDDQRPFNLDEKLIPINIDS
jgi:hypothetical protein